MSDATPAAGRPGNKRGPKRSPLQRAQDLALIEELALRGFEHVQIAAEIGKKRGRSISRQMVSYELQRLARRWEESALESFGQHQAKVLRELQLTASEAWTGWSRSQTLKGEAGNPQFLRVVLDALAHRSRLLGLDSPQRTEISGPAGGPVMLEAAGQQAPLDEKAKLEILRRHLERMERAAQEREKAELTAAPTGVN